MEKIKVYLNDIDTVKKFVRDTSTIEGDVDLIKDSYIIDAKSIMGIFSLDLSKPVTVQIHEPTKENISLIKKYEA